MSDSDSTFTPEEQRTGLYSGAEISPDTVSAAFKAAFGTDPTPEQLQTTLAGYDGYANINNVLRDYNTINQRQSAAGALPFVQEGVDQSAPDAFTTGAHYFNTQGFVPGESSLEGVPTQYFDKDGNLIAWYGSLDEQGGKTTHTPTFAWHSTKELVPTAGFDEEGNLKTYTPKPTIAIPRQDWNSAFREGLLGTAFALSPVAAGMGLSAMGVGAGAGAGAGAEAAASTGLGGLGGAEGSAAIMDSVGQGLAPLATESAGSGLTATEIANYARKGLNGLRTLSSLTQSGGGSRGESGLGSLIAPTAAAALAAGLMTKGSNGEVTAPGLQTAPQVPKFSWNYQPPVLKDPYAAYGSQMLRPQYYDKGGQIDVSSLKSGKNLALPGIAGEADYTKQFAQGGISSLGGYSDGGRMLKGPGDGMSDSIPASIENKRPARLATDEFVVPADVVSHLGNGSSDAGAKVLYAMMDRVRKARTGTKKQGKQISPHKFMPA